MDNKKLEENFKRIQENSLGENKVCEDKRYKRNVIIKIALSVLLSAFLMIGAIGLANNLSNIDFGLSNIIRTEQFEKTKENYNGYSRAEVLNYKNLRVKALLDSNGYTDYERIDGGRFNYHYEAKDYIIIDELDESYLYGFYTLTSEETFNEVLKALGYTDLNDFLIKNNYVDENGNPSIEIWKESDLVFISGIMKKNDDALGGRQ